MSEIYKQAKKSEIQIFLAHANEDKPQIRELYDKLQELGYKPWFDEEDLLPGQNWRDEIPKAVKKSDMFLACLSSTSIRKRGYIQREFKMAMEMLAELPPGTIYLIPLKLDDCEIPDLRQSEYGLNLRDIQWLDYWKPNGFSKLAKAIEHQFERLEKGLADLAPKPLKSGQSTSLNQGDSQLNIVPNHRGDEDNVGGNKTVNNCNDLKGSTGVDYIQLRDFLRNHRFNRADEETCYVMCQVAGRQEQRWLDVKSIRDFPRKDLQIINQLWLEYSNGRFGFSVQKKIYESLGGTKIYNKEVWENFGNYVGWLKEGQWLNFNDLNYSINILDIPEGYFPARFLWVEDFFNQKMLETGIWASNLFARESALIYRAKECNL